MARRHELQTLLEQLLGSEKVFFQPPNNIQLQYPCIIYKRDYADTEFASNNPYTHAKRYQVIHITRDPDSNVPEKIADLPMCLFSRFYTADNLNHDVYNLYF